MRVLCFALVFFMGVLCADAQDGHLISGTVADTTDHTKLIGASVSVLRAKDSVLVTFTRSDDMGHFGIIRIPKGKYILLIAYPDDYADYIEHFTIDSVRGSHNFGTLAMSLRSSLLKEVVIKAQAAAMRMKGDTAEYSVGNLVIKPNAKVEDLLRQIPGMQVDRNGVIKAGGVRITKVLVDGEEFFGDDPTLVTQNIRADMVDKLQLYDSKSDAAIATGIDDGKKVKTLNVKLKEDKKVGYFGKVEGGLGSDGYYEQRGLGNYFTSKYKFAVFESFNNTGKTSLGNSETFKYGFFTSNNNFNPSGLLILSSLGSDIADSWDGRYGGQGLPVARSGGAHFDTKWNNTKETLNANYILNSLTVSGEQNTLSLNNLPLGFINNSTSNQFSNYALRQNADVTVTAKVDSLSTLKFAFNGVLKHFTTKSQFNETDLNASNELLNQSTRTLSNGGDDNNLNFLVSWTKLFHKKGRGFFLSVFESDRQFTASGLLLNQTAYFRHTSIPDSVVQTNQQKNNEAHEYITGISTSFREPLSAQLSLTFNYKGGFDDNNIKRESYNRNGAGLYTILAPQYSSNFDVDQFFNQGGFQLNLQKKKTKLSFGANVDVVSMEQKNNYTGTNTERNYSAFCPTANYTYTISSQSSLNLQYAGNPQQPTFEQIQAVAINNDPLNVLVGNPKLSSAYDHDLSLFLQLNNPTTSEQIIISGEVSMILNPIVSNAQVDSAGRSTYQSINLDSRNVYNYNFYGSWSRKIPKTTVNLGLTLTSTGSVYYNLINQKLNQTVMYSYAPQFAVTTYNKKNQIGFNIGPEYTLLSTNSDKKITSNTSGFATSINAQFDLPGKISIGTFTSYQYKGPSAYFGRDFSRLLINANIDKKFLKDESLRFSLHANDLLNQNAGFERITTSNLIVQNSFNTIKRYVMLSVIYDFSKSIQTKK